LVVTSRVKAWELLYSFLYGKLRTNPTLRNYGKRTHHPQQLQDVTMGKCCSLFGLMTEDANGILQFVTLPPLSPPTPKNVRAKLSTND
jgi:hypothetical protein